MEEAVHVEPDPGEGVAVRVLQEGCAEFVQCGVDFLEGGAALLAFPAFEFYLVSGSGDLKCGPVAGGCLGHGAAVGGCRLGGLEFEGCLVGCGCLGEGCLVGGFELGEGGLVCGSGLFEGGFAGGAVAGLGLRERRPVGGFSGLAGGPVEGLGLLQCGALLPVRDQDAHGDARESHQGRYTCEVHDIA